MRAARTAGSGSSSRSCRRARVELLVGSVAAMHPDLPHGRRTAGHGVRVRARMDAAARRRIGKFGHMWTLFRLERVVSRRRGAGAASTRRGSAICQLLASGRRAYAREPNATVDVTAFFERRCAQAGAASVGRRRARNVVAVSGHTQNSARISARVHAGPRFATVAMRATPWRRRANSRSTAARKFCVLFADREPSGADAHLSAVGYRAAARSPRRSTSGCRTAADQAGPRWCSAPRLRNRSATVARPAGADWPRERPLRCDAARLVSWAGHGFCRPPASVPGRRNEGLRVRQNSIEVCERFALPRVA